MALLLDSDTPELTFQFEEKKQLSSSIRLRNPIENHVAFKILCTRSRRYGVQPWIGILPPGESCEVTVKTQAPRMAPTNMQAEQSRDIFKIQSVLVRPGTTKEDAPNLFNTAVAHMVEESRLRVVYTLPAQVTAHGSHKSTEEPPLATPPEVDEPRSVVEASASQVVRVSILKCFICTFIVMAFYYLMKQTCSLIWTLTNSMMMLMMKMVMKLVAELIEDWVAKTFICVSMPLVCKYKDRLSILLSARVWDRVMDLTNWKTKLIQMQTNWKIK